MDIPIVLIHKTEHFCLKYSLAAAKHYHKDVVLITDIISEKYNDLATVVNINQLTSEKGLNFSKIYRHMSTNSKEFEYVCIERWFILLEYMKQNKVDKVIYIDSDVIVYENLPKLIQEYYNQVDMCLCTPDQEHQKMIWATSGHTFYSSYVALEQLCNFILKTYSENIEELMYKWDWHQKSNNPGGINDMTLLYLFQKQSQLKIGNLLQVINNAFTVDLQIYSSTNQYNDEYQLKDSFLLGKKIKKIKFKKNKPFGYNKVYGKKIDFITIHFQSDSKRIMQFFIKDKKSIKNIISDYKQILYLAYLAIRRELRNVF